MGECWHHNPNNWVTNIFHFSYNIFIWLTILFLKIWRLFNSFLPLYQRISAIRVWEWVKSQCVSINVCWSKFQGCHQYRRMTQKWYFHHLAMIFNLHQKIVYWKVIQFFILWQKSTYVNIILDFSFQVVWYLMTSLWIW